MVFRQPTKKLETKIMKLSLPLVFIKSTSGKYTETRWDLKESNSKTFKKHDTIEITYQISLPKMIL